jgi:hypothetical protein
MYTSEKSIYSKIKYILRLLKDKELYSENELNKYIIRHNLKSFQTFQYDPKEDTTKELVSKNVIKKTIELCTDLKLINVDYSLTNEGINANIDTDYNVTIANQVLKFMKENGVEINKINTIIMNCLTSNTLRLPTLNEIWNELETNIKKEKLSQLLTLLYYCGFARCSQRKLYFGIMGHESL